MERLNYAGFELFNNETLSRVIDKITITKGSQFNFPTAMYKKNKLNQYKAAKLYLNKQTKQVGIEFIGEVEDGTFKMVLSEGGKYGAFIVAKSFFFMNDLKAEDYAGRYDYSEVNLADLGADRPGVMFVIDLNKNGGAE